MNYLINRFLESSHTDPVYFITCVVDVLAIFLLTRLKGALPDLRRSLYHAIIFVSVVLTGVALCKFFGVIKDWKELESLWKS